MNNPYLIVPVVAWVVGQVFKFALKAARGDIDKRYLYSSGGMPSTHAAIVGALAVTALIQGGASSPGFGISAVLMIIVLIDAVNVRRAVGENRRALKTLYSLVPTARRRTKDDDVLESSEALGHTPVEVIAGVILGAVTAYGMLYSRAAQDGWGLQSRPVGLEQIVYFGIFIAMLVIGVALIVVTSRGAARRLQTGRMLRMSFRHILIYPALIGFILLWAQEEGIDFIAGRWLVWFVLLVSLIAGLIYSSVLYSNVRARFERDAQAKESQKRLRKKKRRKR